MAAPVGTHEEREVKFDVPDSFEVPDLHGVVDRKLPGRTIVTSTVHLTSTYFDTAGHDLLRQRISLRRREGDTDTGWHLKVPNALARTEIQVPLGARRSVPARLAKLVRGVALGDPLTPVAVVQTERHLTRIVDTAGATVLEIADDHVDATATGEGATVTRWREVEIELGSGTGADEAALAAFGKALTRAGATASASRSKLAHALGEDASTSTGTTPKDLIADYAAGQFAALTAGDVALRRGLDAVYATRLAARRLRSILRVFAEVLEGDEPNELEDELRWYQHLLGQVRDCQVQRALLARAVGELPAELALGPVAAGLDKPLLAEQARALQDVTGALDSERYLTLMRRLRVFATDPPVLAGTSKAELRELAAGARRIAAARLDKATADDIDPARLHAARKATKRARFATELVVPISGGSATAAIERHALAQETLGDHQDAVVAAANLRRIGTAAGTQPGSNGFTYGLLYERQLAQQRKLRRKIAKFDL